MALLRQQLPPPLPLPLIHSHSSTLKPCLFRLSKTLRLFSLYSAPPPTPSSNSSASIFLPFLEEDHEEEEESVESVAEEEEDDETDDAMVRFFKSRTSTQDPQREGRLSLQKNRRTSWHLAENLDDSEPEEDSGVDPVVEVSKGELGQVGSDSNPLGGGVVDEILQKARSLGENVTLGEELGGFEGRVGEKECVEVLEVMGEEGLLKCCLYFFEWMGLQEPCLVSPRACSVLFPILGRAGMGEQLVVLFKNLPAKKEFRDVRVYNAAISGLMCSKRYHISMLSYHLLLLNL